MTSSSVLIRDAEPSDEPWLTELAADGDDMARPTAAALCEGRWRRRVAVRRGDVLGAAVIVHSDWHPRWSWAHIAVRPEHRRDGVATALAGDLARSRPELKAKVRSGSAAWALTTSLGWDVLQRSEIWEVPTDSEPRFPDEVQVDAPVDQVAAAYFTFYERAHRWDPVGPSKGPQDIYSSHVHDAAATFLVPSGGQPAAVACVWHAEGGVEFSGGACRDGAYHQVALVLQAAAAWACSGGPLLVEVDADMTEVHDALQRRPKRRLDTIEIRGSRGG